MSEIQLLLKKLHTGQMSVINERKRFNVLKCGRRFGKSELLKDLAVETLLDGGYVGYWYPVYKDGAEIWRELKYLLKPIASEINVSSKEIITITGGKLDMWSMEEPDSGRGRKYHRALIDEAEKSKNLKDAWELTIRGTLADYAGDAYIASTPKFGPTYFKTKLFNNEREFDNWKSFRFTTYDNPFISQSEIDEIKSQYAPEVFNCEFMALDVDLNKNRWAFAFDRTKHLGRPEPKKEHLLYLSFDFNRNPISCLVGQHYDGRWRFVEAIKLANSDIYALCTYIKSMYPGYVYMVTGDASGQSSSALVKDNLNYYMVIRKMLELSGQQMRIPSVNPKLEENQVLFNSILANYPVEMHEKKCDALIFDLENVAALSDGRIDKGNRDDPSKQADILDCFVGETMVDTINGKKRIDSIEINDLVLTRFGYKHVIDKWSSDADVYEFETERGITFKCTKNHKFYTNSFGFLPICSIFEKNIPICVIASNTMEVCSQNTQNKNIITPQLKAKKNLYIENCGKIITERLRKGITYTTKTETALTIRLKTSKLSKPNVMRECTENNGFAITRKDLKNYPRLVGRMLKSGMDQKKVLSGTNSMLKTSILVNSSTEFTLANHAIKSLKNKTNHKDSVQTIVKVHGEGKIILTKSIKNVMSADKNLLHSNIIQEHIAQQNASQSVSLNQEVLKSMRYIGKAKVYDITVNEEHEFFANGILVHNCARYMFNTFMYDFLKRI